jgi:hypothetical protein
MALTLDQFANNLQKLVAKIPQRSGEVIQEVAQRTHAALVIGTPVKTGKARSNWQAGLDGRVPSGTLAPTSQGGALAAGEQQIYAKVSPKSIALVNNVDYVDNLNAGSSSQAPAGFVEAAVNVGERVAEQVRLLRDGDF